MQVLDELGAGLAERDGPGGGGAVGVAGVGEDVAERDAAAAGHALQDRDEGAGRVEVAAGQGHPAGELGDGGGGLFGRPGGGVRAVAEEQPAPRAGPGAGGSPPGGLGGAPAGGGGS